EDGRSDRLRRTAGGSPSSRCGAKGRPETRRGRASCLRAWIFYIGLDSVGEETRGVRQYSGQSPEQMGYGVWRGRRIARRPENAKKNPSAARLPRIRALGLM